MFLSHHLRLQTTAAVAALLIALPFAAAAGPIAPASIAGAPATSLKHLPAGHDELVFRGESARRSWPVYLDRGEIERTRVFQLALKNAVALLPERSSIKLAINGHLLATMPARSPDGLTVVSVAIPPGVLVPGFNSIDVAVTMAHRVDCSTAATYELWSLLDPAQTGLVVPPSAAGIRSLDDLTAQPLSEDGTTHITLRSAETGDAEVIERAARLIDALVSRTAVARPVVRVDPAGGRGPGFDVVLTAGARAESVRGLTVLGREDGVIFAKDAEDRPVLVMSGTDGADLDRQIAALAAKAGRAGPPSPAGRMIVDGEIRRSFAALGLSTESFAGRRYASALDVVLPSDYYPANYDKAQLLIDGSYAADLDPDSNLVFRVNGALVSSLRLGPDRGGVLRHELVELPLRFFHPGHNEIALEAITSTPADRQCDAAGMNGDTRFTLAGTTEIAFPRFAHLGTVPQIPGAMAGAHASDGNNTVDLYLPEGDAASVGSGLTVLANMTLARRDRDVPRVHIGPLDVDGPPGVVVGPFDALPTALREDVRTRMAVVVDGRSEAHQTDTDTRSEAAGAPDAKSRLDLDPQALVAGAQGLLRNQGFFFGSDQSAQTVPMSARSLMVAAVVPHPQSENSAGLNLPRFTASTAQWLVVTAADDAALSDGLTRLVSDGQWAALDGQAVSLDPKSGRLASIQPSHVLYVVPDSLVLSDLRPILGGMVSNHIELSLIVLMLLMAILGLSTHALIRRTGVK